MVIGMIHCSSPDLYLIPGDGLQSHHPAACGLHCVTAVGLVFCVLIDVAIDEEVSTVSLPGGHHGMDAEAKPPGSSHRHSEDT